jgi:TatD DNase family protein
MILSNLYSLLTLASPDLKGKKLPFCHTAMIPWTAEFVAGLIGKGE